MNGPDEIGHLAYKTDDTPYPGLCHCARDQAHYADGDAPVTGTWAIPREQIRLLGRRIIAYYSRRDTGAR